jgi:hypothetical protein
MGTARSRGGVREPEGAAVPPVLDEVGAEQAPAWEEIDVGRYMPRRIRGSCRGRVLG